MDFLKDLSLDFLLWPEMELTKKDFFAVFSDLFLWPIVELAEKEKYIF